MKQNPLLKKQSLVPLFLFACSFFIFSCSKITITEEIKNKENDTKESYQAKSGLASVAVDSNTIYINYVSTIAALHNPGVDYNYSQVRTVVPKIGIQDSLTASKVVSKINTGTDTYVSNQLGSQNLRFSTLVFDRNFHKFNSSVDKIKDIIAQKSGRTLTLALALALDTVQMYVINSTDTTLLKTTLNNFLTTKVRILPNAIDKIILAAVVKVSLNSLSYWCVNLEKWNLLINGSGPIPKAGLKVAARLPWGNIIKDAVLDDAIGAGTGVVAGALIGASGGTVTIPLVGTVAGAVGGGLVGMAGGAIKGSVGSVVVNVLKSWLDW